MLKKNDFLSDHEPGCTCQAHTLLQKVEEKLTELHTENMGAFKAGDKERMVRIGEKITLLEEEKYRLRFSPNYKKATNA